MELDFKLKIMRKFSLSKIVFKYSKYHFLLYLFFGIGILLPMQAQLPPGFIDEDISGPWQYPAGITFDAHGQGYLWDNNGRVFIITLNGNVLPAPLLDIREEAIRFLDQGMLGFVLDPDFLENGYFYVLYTVDPHHLRYFGTSAYDPTASDPYRGTIGRISRFTADKNQGFRKLMPNSQLVLLGQTAADGFPLLADSHSIGSLVFGADGSLLATCGDGASATSIDVGSNPQTHWEDGLELGIIRPDENIGMFRSQLLTSLSGKVVRLNPATGTGLPGNPYYEPTAPRSAQSRVWALGLRNPFRMTYVPYTGGHTATDPGWFLIGDVGEGRWEEINLLRHSGQNFGWPLLEGFEPHPHYATMLTAHAAYSDQCGSEVTFQDLFAQSGVPTCCPECPPFYPTTPRVAYRNRWDEISIPMVYVAADSNMQATGVPLPQGAFFQGDASIGGIVYTGHSYPESYHGRYFHADFRNWISVFELDELGNFLSVTPFYEGAKKVVSMAVHPIDGFLYYTSMDDLQLHRIRYGGFRAIKAAIAVNQRWGASPLTLQLDGSGSVGATDSLAYEWSFGDGATSSEPVPAHTFVATGSDPAILPVQLIVTDSLGRQDTAQVEIVVNDAPPDVRLLTPIPDLHYSFDGIYPILGSALVSDIQTPAADLAYLWTLLLHHEDHTHVAADKTDIQPQFLLSPLGCVEDDYHYTLRLKVTDANHLTTQVETQLYPDCNETDWIEFDYLYAAQAADGRYTVSWQTAYEMGAVSFDIEAAANGQSFVRLGSLPATGTATGARYTTTLPGGSVPYRLFRVRAYSLLPAFRLSPVGMLYEDEHTSFTTLRPNPATDILWIDLEQASARRTRIWLYDRTGQEVGTFIQDGLSGVERTVEVSVGRLPQGVYHYRLEDGPRTEWGQFVKQ